MTGFTNKAISFGLTFSLGATAVHAQTPVQFGLGAGVSIPSGSFNNGLKTGWHGLALVQLMPPASPVGFRVDGSYNQLKFDAGDGKYQIIAGTANVLYELKASPETRLRPYLIAGGGVYNLKAKPDGAQSSSATKFGVNGGAGFNFGASAASLFVEARFHKVFVTGSDLHLIPITVGVRFGGG